MNKELDKLVAEEVMGWTLDYTVGYPEPHTFAYKDKEGKTYSGFSPSVNLEHAWMALDTVCEANKWRAIIDRNTEQTEVNFKTKMGATVSYYGIAKTPALAICEAVLESVGVRFYQPS